MYCGGTGTWNACPQTGAGAFLFPPSPLLFTVLFFLFFAPVIRLFDVRAFSFAISMAFPVFDARLPPVNRLYFFRRTFATTGGLSRALECKSRPRYMTMVMTMVI
jgi:hypothetical protein